MIAFAENIVEVTSLPTPPAPKVVEIPEEKVKEENKIASELIDMDAQWGALFETYQEICEKPAFTDADAHKIVQAMEFYRGACYGILLVAHAFGHKFENFVEDMPSIAELPDGLEEPDLTYLESKFSVA